MSAFSFFFRVFFFLFCFRLRALSSSSQRFFPFSVPPPPQKKKKVQQAYLITFGRAGEDNKKFKLGDVERTLEGFAGADYNLQDALTAATDKKAQRREGSEQEFYDYEVAGPDFTYLAAVTLNSGKVFALFVSSPTKSFKSDERALRHIVESFKTI